MKSEYLIEDIFTETEGKIETDNKNERMLDTYFIKNEEITCEKLLSLKPEERSKVKDCGYHLYIDFIELRNFKEILDKLYFDIDKYQTKYKDFYEDLSKNIYPNRDKKIEPKEFNNPNLSLHIFCFLVMIVSYIVLLTKKYIIFLIIYIIGVIAQLLLISDNKFFCEQLKGKNLQKLQRILNAQPILELYYNKHRISKIPFHSYADISGIGFKKDKDSETLIYEKIDLKNDNIIMLFPIKFLYFVDSTQQYFKFLILEFMKYCFLEENSYSNLYRKMYFKYSLQTKDGQIISKNDSFFNTYFTTINKVKLYLINFFGAFTLLSTIIILILKRIIKIKLIDIKKTVSIKHNLEEYLNLDMLFPKFINGSQEIKREKHAIISDRKSIQEEFKQECINIYNKKVKYLNEWKKYQSKKLDPDIEIERQGYLTPFNDQTFFSLSFHYFSNCEFYCFYGTKVKKIFGKDENDIFRNFFSIIKMNHLMNRVKFKENVDYYYNLYDYNGKYKDNYNDYIYSNDNNFIKTDYNSNNNEDYDDDENNNDNNDNNYENLKQVIYTEKCLILTIDISHNFVYVNYSIRLPNNGNKNGKFSLPKKFGGFEKLEEKENVDWTKSEIYIPTCNYVIEIIRKKRAIKISAGDSEIISETITNPDLHGGAISWTDENDWDQRTINKYVKDCTRVSKINRFKTKYN